MAAGLNILRYGSRDTERRATPQRHRIGVAQGPECAPQAGQHQLGAKADRDSHSDMPADDTAATAAAPEDVGSGMLLFSCLSRSV